MKKKLYGSLITALVLVSVFVFAACNNSNDSVSTANNSSETMNNMNHNSNEMMNKDGDMNHEGSKKMKTVSTDFSAKRNSQTSMIIDAYEQMKTALDANDKNKTAEGAKAMLAALDKFDSTKLDDSKRKEYADIFETAKEHSEHIMKSELDHQKEHFESLTKDVNDLFTLVSAEKK
ncbi:MAG: DUF3347 domain-containing protein [Acidobacteria bacterium]|nr:DUF3347 domain-containing protein [Acidobacteriota bacterium]